ncbi:hypothetical protein [Niameybacter massiliensis]|uniref:hypothetical protein n=1 Tax=Niameybacter massiliensis TaxID=1658108 RepID=UPI0006B5044E|nr:hypothetical protein [Niameybacter massiliensis]
MMNNKIWCLFNASQEMKKPFVFEGDGEIEAIEKELMKILGYKQFCKYETLCNQRTGVAEERAYVEGFKDALKLFMEVHS